MNRKTAVEYYVNPIFKVVSKIVAKPFGIPGEIVAGIVGDVATTKAKEVATTLDDKEKQERLKEIGSWVAERLFAFAEGEATAGVEAEWLHDTLALTLDRAAGQLAPGQIGKLAGDRTSWEVWVKANLPDPKQHRGGEAGQQALTRCGQYAALLLADAAVTLPSWLKATVTGLSERLVALEREQDEQQAKALQLREAYRQHLCDDLDKMELFGARLPLDDRTYPLSVAYISLRLQGISNVGQEAERLLDGLKPEQRHFFIEGKAGSGKTTLLRWIAVTAASYRQPNFETWRWNTCPRPRNEYGSIQKWSEGEEEEQQGCYANLWRFQLPLLIRFRDLLETGLPAPTQFPHWLAARPSSNHLAPEWLEKELQAGRVLLLFDGLDEVPSVRQNEVFKQLNALIAWYGNCRIVVSSRPLSRMPVSLREKLQKLELEDLTRQDQHHLVEYWYKAFSEKRRHQTLRQGELTSEGLLERGKSLQEQLPLHTEASNLAKVPLLCALICAIFARDDDKTEPQLPDRLIGLCEEVCTMLLRDRPEQSSLKIAEFGPVYGKLPDSVKLALLRELAFEMVVSHESKLDEERAIAVLQSELGDECPKADAGDFLHTYVTVSGLLRFGEGGAVEFLHNTIKEYLASQKLASRGNWKLITEDPESEICQRLSLFASYNEDWGRSVIEKLLEKEKTSKPARLLALRCWGVLPLKNRYREIMLKIREEFIPPSNFIEAEAIAVEAEGIVSRLAYNPEHNPETAAACVLALHRIRTSDAEIALEEYAAKEGRFEALKVLCEIRNPLTVQWLRTRVKKYDPFEGSDEELELKKMVTTRHLEVFLQQHGSNVNGLYLDNTSVTSLSGLEHCPNLQMLSLDNTSVSSLSGLEGCLNLQWFSLNNTSVTSLSGLEHCPNLKGLSLTNSSVSSLSGLEHCANLKELYLDNTSVTSLSGLEHCPNLQILSLANTSVSQEEMQQFEQRRKCRVL